VVSETWSVFRFEELDAIVFECPECRTESVFRTGGDPAGETERHCPGCNRRIPRAGEILRLYRQLYAAIGSAIEHEKVTITLRAKPS
jgi:hypothetical protein